MSSIADVERTLDELIELGGPRLATRWPGIASLRAIAGEIEASGNGERGRLVEELQSTATAMYGGYGSFTDFGIDGPESARFERLKDELSRQIGRL